MKVSQQAFPANHRLSVIPATKTTLKAFPASHPLSVNAVINTNAIRSKHVSTVNPAIPLLTVNFVHHHKKSFVFVRS